MDKFLLFYLGFMTLSALNRVYTACFLRVASTSAAYTGIRDITQLYDAWRPTCFLCVAHTSTAYTGARRNYFAL